jgi:hypothetical protein
MKRTTRTTLFGLTALGALALPIGLVSADDADEPTDEPAVVCEQKQYRQRDGSGDQIRQRQQAEACDGECDGSQVRARFENRAMEPQGSQLQQRLRAECDGECDGSQVRARVEDRAMEPQGSPVQERLRAECDGECDGSQVRARVEDRAMEPQGSPVQERLQVEECDGDCEPQREQSDDATMRLDRLTDGAGEMQRSAGR